MSKNYGNWCPEIYKGMFIDQFNDDKIRIAPCCQARSTLELVDTFDFNNSPYLTKLRDQFSQGLQPMECNRCWEAEKLGQKSRRKSAIEFFDYANPVTDVQLESLDYSATWACNMACIMCGPELSSFWAKNSKYPANKLATIGRKFQKDNDILSKVDVSKIKKIHFNGGEPFLNNHQRQLFNRLDKHNALKDVFVSYNTNGSIYPDEEIVSLWSRCRLIKLFYSIDAVDQAFEYIRWPGKWEQVLKNITTMKNSLPTNVMFGVNITVGNYNLLELKDLWDWFSRSILTNRENDPSDFNWQIAYNYNPTNCKDEVKLRAIEELSDIDAFSGLVSYLKSSIGCTESTSWIATLDELDTHRNTNWRNSLKIAEYY